MRMFVVPVTALLLSAAIGSLVPARIGGGASQGSAPLAERARPPARARRALSGFAARADPDLARATPAKVGALSEWLTASKTLKGTALQDAATAAGFEPSFVALALFPAGRRPAWPTSWTGRRRSARRSRRIAPAVFASIQRLRDKAQDAGTLKDTPQQAVETETTATGQQVIVIEPANPQVVYVPQYNPQVGLHPPSTRSSIEEDRQRRRRRRRPHRVHRRHRDRRRHGQRLLLRSVRVGRRLPHVQRRVGQLVRPSRGRARGLAWTTARTSSTSAASGGRRGRSSAPSGQRTAGGRHGDAGAAHRAAAANAAGDPRRERSARTATGTRQPRAATAATRPTRRKRRAQRHRVGCLLRLLERQSERAASSRGQSSRAAARAAAVAAVAASPVIGGSDADDDRQRDASSLARCSPCACAAAAASCCRAADARRTDVRDAGGRGAALARP